MAVTPEILKHLFKKSQHHRYSKDSYLIQKKRLADKEIDKEVNKNKIKRKKCTPRKKKYVQITII